MNTTQEIEALCVEGDVGAASEAAREFLDHTIRCGPQSDDRAWLSLRLAVMWLNELEPVVAIVWTHRALMEGPRADAFALLGEAALLEQDEPLAANWFALARKAVCPERHVRGVMEMLDDRIRESVAKGYLKDG